MAKWIPAWRYVPIDYNQELAAPGRGTSVPI